MVDPFVVDYLTEMKAERISGGFTLFPIRSISKYDQGKETN